MTFSCHFTFIIKGFLKKTSGARRSQYVIFRKWLSSQRRFGLKLSLGIRQASYLNFDYCQTLTLVWKVWKLNLGSLSLEVYRRKLIVGSLSLLSKWAAKMFVWSSINATNFFAILPNIANKTKKTLFCNIGRYIENVLKQDYGKFMSEIEFSNYDWHLCQASVSHHCTPKLIKV